MISASRLNESRSEASPSKPGLVGTSMPRSRSLRAAKV